MTIQMDTVVKYCALFSLHSISGFFFYDLLCELTIRNRSTRVGWSFRSVSILSLITACAHPLQVAVKTDQLPKARPKLIAKLQEACDANSYVSQIFSSQDAKMPSTHCLVSQMLWEHVLETQTANIILQRVQGCSEQDLELVPTGRCNKFLIPSWCWGVDAGRKGWHWRIIILILILIKKYLYQKLYNKYILLLDYADSLHANKCYELAVSELSAVRWELGAVRCHLSTIRYGLCVVSWELFCCQVGGVNSELLLAVRC